MLALADEPGTFVLLVIVALRTRHPFRPCETSFLVKGMAAALPYPTLPRLTLRITLKTPGRCLSPTSATDLRNTHPSTVRLLSPQLALQRPSPRCAQGLKPQRHSEHGVGPPFTVIRPQIKKRLTTPLEASDRSHTISPSLREDARHFPGVTLPLRIQQQEGW